MPTAATPERFNARVESHAHVQAIEEYCAGTASMQETQAAPRDGRSALGANQARLLARARPPPAAGGDGRPQPTTSRTP